MDRQISPNDSLGHLLYTASKYMQLRLNRSFAGDGYDATVEQWKILAHLWIRDGQNQQELSEKTERSKVSATKIIDGLERRNLVVRIPDENDRRSNRIYLTHKGKGMQEALTVLAEKNLDVAGTGISADDMETCKRVLRQVIENMKASAPA